MDAKKLLMGVATTAVGWMFGLWAYKSFMSGGSSMTMPSTTPTDASASSEPSEFGYSGYDY